MVHSVPRIVALTTVRDLIFFISMVEVLSKPTKHENEILVSIFLTMNATILDTHGRL